MVSTSITNIEDASIFVMTPRFKRGTPYISPSPGEECVSTCLSEYFHLHRSNRGEGTAECRILGRRLGVGGVDGLDISFTIRTVSVGWWLVVWYETQDIYRVGHDSADLVSGRYCFFFSLLFSFNFFFFFLFSLPFPSFFITDKSAG